MALGVYRPGALGLGLGDCLFQLQPAGGGQGFPLAGRHQGLAQLAGVGVVAGAQQLPARLAGPTRKSHQYAIHPIGAGATHQPQHRGAHGKAAAI